MIRVPYNVLRQNLDHHLGQVVESGIPILVTRQGGGSVVIMPHADFNGWSETTHLLNSPANAERLLKSVRSATASPIDQEDLTQERIVRLIRIFAEAAELFGGESAALAWLTTPGDYLKGERPITPMALAMTDAGAELVEAHMRRTAHGMY